MKAAYTAAVLYFIVPNTNYYGQLLLIIMKTMIYTLTGRI